MARKPIDRANPGREAIWAAIRQFSGGAFSVSDLTGVTDANNKTVRDYCKGLTAAGYLSYEAPTEVGQAGRWTLIRDIGHEAPRVRPDGSAVTQGTVTEQLWRGMYILKEFSYLDLIETASVKIPVETAKSYCHMLLVTGYLRVLRKADPARSQVARYRLVRNNGPKPPQIQRVKRVYDPNSQEVFMPEARS